MIEMRTAASEEAMRSVSLPPPIPRAIRCLVISIQPRRRSRSRFTTAPKRWNPVVARAQAVLDAIGKRDGAK
jgi:hypothetical protein